MGYRSAVRGVVLMASAALAPLLMGGCPQPTERLNSPPQGYSEHPSPMREYYTYHNDQGMLNDMSLADIHFVPHSPDLSGTGVARLERYCELLATSGGTIHYDSGGTDQELVKARLASAKSFVSQAMPGVKDIQIVQGMPGGRGMNAKEASEARKVAQQPEPRKTAYKLQVYSQTSN